MKEAQTSLQEKAIACSGLRPVTKRIRGIQEIQN